jgi:Cu+-exporting ATPase
MWTLIGLGTGAAFVYSVVATVAPQVFPASFRMGRVAVYFEAAAVIISLTLLGQVLELKARSQTSRGDQGAARPGAQDRAAHRADGSEEDIPLATCIRRRPAARAPGREGAGRRRRVEGSSASTNRC